MAEYKTDYKGDSEAKRICRLQHWIAVRAWIGEEDFKRGPHLVFASEDAGDVAVLRALGVPAESILAFDIRQDAITKAKTNLPEAIYVCGDAGKALARMKGAAASVLLDFCGWATPRSLELISEAATAVRHGGVIGYAFMRGREPKWFSAEMAERTQPIVSQEPDIGRPRRAPADRRRLFIAAKINDSIKSKYRIIFPFNIIRYRGHAVPMMIEATWLWKGTPGKGPRQIAHAAAEWLAMYQEFAALTDFYDSPNDEEIAQAATLQMRLARSVELELGWIPAIGLEFLGRRRRLLIPPPNGFGQSRRSPKDASIDITDIAATLEREGVDAALALNLTKAQLAARRAMATKSIMESAAKDGITVVREGGGYRASLTVVVERSDLETIQKMAEADGWNVALPEP